MAKTKTPELLDVAAVAEMLGIQPRTWTSYVARGQAPEPDGHVGRSPWWAPATIERYRQERDARQQTEDEEPTA